MATVTSRLSPAVSKAAAVRWGPCPSSVSVRHLPIQRFFRTDPLDTRARYSAEGDAILLEFEFPDIWILSDVGSKSTLPTSGIYSEARSYFRGPIETRTATPTGFSWIPLQAETRIRSNTDWFPNCVSRISGFVQLPKDWDGYGSAPPNRVACSRALDVAVAIAQTLSLADSVAQDPFVAPLSSGGVLFEIRNGNRELHIEVPPDSEFFEVLKVARTPSGDEVEEELHVNEAGLFEVLSWVSRAG